MDRQLDQQKIKPIVSKQPGPAECAQRLNPPHPAWVHTRVKFCKNPQYSSMIRLRETPTGSPHAADPDLPLRSAALFAPFSPFFRLLGVFLASLARFLGSLGPLLGSLALNFAIFIDFVPLQPRFSTMFLHFWCPPVTSTP